MPTVRALPPATAILLAAAPLAALPAKAQAPNKAWEALCTAQETPIRGCVMKSGKYVAFCIPKGQDLKPTTGDKGPLSAVPPVGYMQYRFGRPGAVELRFPDRLAGSARRFRYSWELYPRGAATVIAFDRGRYIYQYTNRFLARGQGEGHAVTHGITVWRDGKMAAFLPCTDHQR